MLGEDGRPFKTRSGDTVGSTGLLDEAVSRASSRVRERRRQARRAASCRPSSASRSPRPSASAAIKYADLSQNRASDYVFSYDKMLAMNGNTATYMQYAYARVRSIFQRAKPSSGRLGRRHADRAGEPAERALALELLRFGEALPRWWPTIGRIISPIICSRWRIAIRRFYEQCHVLKAETPELKRSRLALCDITARTLRLG